MILCGSKGSQQILSVARLLNYENMAVALADLNSSIDAVPLEYQSAIEFSTEDSTACVLRIAPQSR